MPHCGAIAKVLGYGLGVRSVNRFNQGNAMSGPMFRGSIPALITPIANGHVDESAFQRFVDWQIEQGSHGVVPCGTTGESPTLSHDEHMRVVELCVEAVRGRVPVIAGTGSNSTAEAIALTRHAKKAGADAVLLVTPYYNKPTQEGLYQHFKAIHDAVEIPILIYNIPNEHRCRSPFFGIVRQQIVTILCHEVFCTGCRQ